MTAPTFIWPQEARIAAIHAFAEEKFNGRGSLWDCINAALNAATAAMVASGEAKPAICHQFGANQEWDARTSRDPFSPDTFPVLIIKETK